MCRWRVSAIVVFAAAFALSGCVARVKSDVSAFSAMEASDQGAAVYIAPYDDAQGNSLEWKTYADLMAGQLRAKGFKVAPSPDHADLLAFFGYAIDNGSQVTSTYSVPNWGVTGYSSGYTSGTYTSTGSGYGTYSGTTYLQPEYGITGYSTHTDTHTVYTRSLAIDMVEVGSGDKKWEMRLSSTGSCSRFAAVAEEFFKAAFKSFPDGKGGTEIVDWNGKC